MIRAFEIFEQLLNFFEVRQSQFHRLHDKWFSERLCCGCQAQPQDAIYDLLEGLAGLAHFLGQKGCHVIIKRKSSSHILMLTL